jgi:hypothetical protein
VNQFQARGATLTHRRPWHWHLLTLGVLSFARAGFLLPDLDGLGLPV